MPSRTKVAVLGSSGLLGGDLVQLLKSNFAVTGIDKENYEKHCGKHFDVLINANGNSKRYWANEHPAEDFETSTVSVYKTFFDFTCDTYVYISSSDVYPDHTRPAATAEDQEIDLARLAPYGFHKYLGEQIVRHMAKRFIILRSSMILGSSLRKGAVFDILEGRPLFITSGSRLQMISTEGIASIITQALAESGSGTIFNMGGRGTVAFDAAERIFEKPISFSPEAEEQIYEMDVQKLHAVHPLKTSEEYLQEFLALYNEAHSHGKEVS